MVPERTLPLVKSTEDSDIEYVNQIPAPDYVNACWVDFS